MSDSPRPKRSGFAARPTDPEAWVRREALNAPVAPPSPFTARLTIDVTPALRGRIKVAAFQRGLTVADMLRRLLDQAYGSGPSGERRSTNSTGSNPTGGDDGGETTS